ncbi:hypothetical protein Cgig2_003317 [Carnegiea gigantea]|uniref:PGG domain-containing protein n=1 Tax=Carnegiea gigantea TaxID=171969 RepID=A0A9Q1QAC9_9CARY|nr:hypothetical protein Cgig2_003317 [Carnegiea gigantea]
MPASMDLNLLIGCSKVGKTMKLLVVDITSSVSSSVFFFSHLNLTKERKWLQKHTPYKSKFVDIAFHNPAYRQPHRTDLRNQETVLTNQAIVRFTLQGGLPNTSTRPIPTVPLILVLNLQKKPGVWARKWGKKVLKTFRLTSVYLARAKIRLVEGHEDGSQMARTSRKDHTLLQETAPQPPSFFSLHPTIFCVNLPAKLNRYVDSRDLFGRNHELSIDEVCGIVLYSNQDITIPWTTSPLWLIPVPDENLGEGKTVKTACEPSIRGICRAFPGPQCWLLVHITVFRHPEDTRSVVQRVVPVGHPDNNIPHRGLRVPYAHITMTPCFFESMLFEPIFTRAGVNPDSKTPCIQPSIDLTEMRNMISIVAAPLATTAFTAGFTLPGGLSSDNGEAVLVKKATFLETGRWTVPLIIRKSFSMTSVFSSPSTEQPRSLTRMPNRTAITASPTRLPVTAITTSTLSGPAFETEFDAEVEEGGEPSFYFILISILRRPENPRRIVEWAVLVGHPDDVLHRGLLYQMPT